ncbi:hypothetical protein SAMN05421776_12110 [Nocardia farcinica]|uniref:Phage protein n=1 Tax=Nocardia farcinica TaxID=37329 RepID=A0A0H5PPE0_NOCFR|nr:hypothetical protein [Nocardia farcinica]SLG33504.1 Uncharacterised protein [Mycobacteroides abscessus subsp. abscessus]AXK88586.1 hypothetical protein DXT66_25845 [Nocardia farcinica]MBF6540724.1 hypothetical protein [Nocardia farcinica]PFW98895.1 hypothetical protein CJ469_05856 [Nocardia farcinica]PFX04501.1 hypothetical protein CJ468_05477 [Nocardia farcinica]
MTTIYLLEYLGDEDLGGRSYPVASFSTVEKAQAYVAKRTRRDDLIWNTMGFGQDNTLYTHIETPSPDIDDDDYYAVDGYYITTHTLDPEPGDDDD